MFNLNHPDTIAEEEDDDNENGDTDDEDKENKDSDIMEELRKRTFTQPFY